MRAADASPRRGAAWAAVARAALLGTVGLAALLAPPGAAAASPRGLAEAPCPPVYRVLHAEDHPAGELAAARQGRFTIAGSTQRLVPPVDWGRDPLHSRAYQGSLHNLTWLDLLFSAYRGGDGAALAQARDLVLDWIGGNPRPPGGSEAPKAWFDKVAADRAPYIAFLARAGTCEGLLSGAEARLLLASLREHARYLAHPRPYAATNHGLFVDFGLVALARQLAFADRAPRWRRLGERRFERTLRGEIFPREGLFLEQSTAYQHAVARLLGSFLEVAGPDRGLGRILGRMREVAGWLTMPDGGTVLLGDSNLGDDLVWPGGSARDLGSRERGLLWLPRSGLAAVKRPSPAAHLAVAATFFRGIHKHSDELTFDLYDRGRRIVADSGLYDNDPGPWRAFSRSSAAHSVLTVDGRSFPRGERHAYGSGLRAAGVGAGWYAILGANPLLRAEGVRHRRLLAYRPGFALVVVDAVRADRAHVYDRLFQLGHEIAADPRPEVVALTADGLDAELTSAATTPQSRELVRGSEHPLGGFVFPTFRRAIPRWTVGYRTVGEDVDHVATFGLDPAGAARAALVGAARPTGTTIDVVVPGSGGERLEIVRHGAELDVRSVPVAAAR